MSLATFFRKVFAQDGDVNPVPFDPTNDGTMSIDTGWGYDYERDQTSDTLAKDIDRGQMNTLWNMVTRALQQYQIFGFPDFITAADNNGQPYGYTAQAFARFGGIVYQSLVDNNTATPLQDVATTGDHVNYWRPFLNLPGVSTGMLIPYEGIVLPAGGWIWPNGSTVGDVNSGANGLADPSTKAYFTMVWNTYPDAVRPIYDSTGARTTRGISAAADYAAQKAIKVRDMRGVFYAGFSLMGGAADNHLLTGFEQGIDASQIGTNGGEQAHTLVDNEVPPTAVNIQSSTDESTGAGGTIVGARGTSVQNVNKVVANIRGGGAAHNIVPPSTVGPWILKL